MIDTAVVTSPDQSLEQLLRTLQEFGETSSSIKGISRDPLKDAIVQILRDGECDLESELRLVKKAIQQQFDNLEQKKHKPAERWDTSMLFSYLNLIKIARERYASVTGLDHWNQYLEILQVHAAKHLHSDPRGIRFTKSIELFQETLQLLEQLDQLLPSAEIESLRDLSNRCIRAQIFEDLEDAYNPRSTTRQAATVHENANKYGIELPSKEEYWQHKLVETVHLLKRRIANLKHEQFAYDEVKRDIKGAKYDIEVNEIGTIEIGKEIKPANDFLDELTNKYLDALAEFQKSQFRLEFELVMNRMLDDIASSDSNNGMAPAFRHLSQRVNSVTLPEIKTIVSDLIANRIDPLLDDLADQLKKDKSNVGTLGTKIAVLGDIRYRLTTWQ